MNTPLFQCLLAFHFLRAQLYRLGRNVKRTDEVQQDFNPATAFAVLILDRFMDNDTICKQAQLFIRKLLAVPKPSRQFQEAFGVILGGNQPFKLLVFRRNGFLHA